MHQVEFDRNEIFHRQWLPTHWAVDSFILQKWELKMLGGMTGDCYKLWGNRTGFLILVDFAWGVKFGIQKLGRTLSCPPDILDTELLDSPAFVPERIHHHIYMRYLVFVWCSHKKLFWHLQYLQLLRECVRLHLTASGDILQKNVICRHYEGSFHLLKVYVTLPSTLKPAPTTSWDRH